MTIDEIFDEAAVALGIEAHLRTNNLWTKRSHPLLIARRYKQALLEQLGSKHHMRNPMDEKYNHYIVSTKELEVACGRYGSRSKQQYWWPILNKLCPLIAVVTQGSNFNGQYTKVKTMFEYDWEAQYVYTIKGLIESDPESDEKYEWVDIDLQNLGHYMLSAYSKTVQDKAAKIFAIAEQFPTEENWGKLPMLKKKAASGRMYYGGVNLHNTPSAVRHAALGKHFSYDLNTSVFAWQVSMMRALFGYDRNTHPPHTSYTRELMADKKRIRGQFTDCFRDTYYEAPQIASMIKQAITAISFGARSSATYINEHNELTTEGLASIIKHKESREAFCNHPWMKEFLKEQDMIVSLLYEATHDLFINEPACLGPNKRVNKKKLLAFLYQRAESRAMKDLITRCKDKTVLLWVHDGFCTRHRIPLADMQFILQQDHCIDWTIEETFHKGYADPDVVKVTSDAQRILNDAEEKAERAERIRVETEMWATRGADTRNWHTNNIVQFKPKHNTEGHYNNSTSDYDLGKNDPAVTLAGARGLLNEQQFIERIYGKK
jgi:hypothetical protein